MRIRRPALPIGLAVVTLAAGCGGRGSSNAHRSTQAGGGPLPRSAQTPLRTGASGGTTAAVAALTIPGIGTLRYSCSGSPQSAHGLLGGRVLATENVHVQDGSLTHLRAGQLGPPAELSASARGAVMLWHIVQSDEARTNDVVLRIAFSPACSAARWSTSVRTIGHQGQWRLPAPWL